MTLSRPIIAALAVLVCGTGLVACTTGPRAPLMSPLEAGAGFGYSHRQLAENRFEVSYLGPNRRTSLAKAKRDEDAKDARDLARDLALWRAAELASASGFTTLTIENSQSDLEVEIVNEGPFFPHFGYIHPFGPHNSGFHHHGFGSVYRSAWLQARVTITVAMHAGAPENALDAETTARRLRRQYPGAHAPAVE